MPNELYVHAPALSCVILRVPQTWQRSTFFVNACWGHKPGRHGRAVVVLLCPPGTSPAPTVVPIQWVCMSTPCAQRVALTHTKRCRGWSKRSHRRLQSTALCCTGQPRSQPPLRMQQRYIYIYSFAQHSAVQHKPAKRRYAHQGIASHVAMSLDGGAGSHASQLQPHDALQHALPQHLQSTSLRRTPALDALNPSHGKG
jgi:hypothetical protein